MAPNYAAQDLCFYTHQLHSLQYTVPFKQIKIFPPSQVCECNINILFNYATFTS